MAKSGMVDTSELVGPLAERGGQPSYEQVYRPEEQTPQRWNVDIPDRCRRSDATELQASIGNCSNTAWASLVTPCIQPLDFDEFSIVTIEREAITEPGPGDMVITVPFGAELDELLMTFTIRPRPDSFAAAVGVLIPIKSGSVTVTEEHAMLCVDVPS